MAQKNARKRTIRLIRPPNDSGLGVVCLTNRGKQAFYAFREVPCAIGGRGLALHRLGRSELYHVRVGTPEDCSCECLGFFAHGHCKHIAGMLTLMEQGTIDGEPRA